MTLVLPDALADLSPDEAEELACRAHLGVWTERRRGLPMAGLHWEWTELAMTVKRLCVMAPREHSKTETFTVNATSWRTIYTPGLWTYVFSATDDQAKEQLEKIWQAVDQIAPWLTHRRRPSALKLRFNNGARVDGAGAGKAVRGKHPDIVVGDDVLEEKSCLTELMRKRTERWWKGTVGGMAHSGVSRDVRPFPGAPWEKVHLPPTRFYLVGTPFHEQDLLNVMRTNRLWKFRRYAAEFRPDELVAGSLAVEAA